MILTPQQRAAVEHPGGYARIIAGAGTGKTQTLVERTVYLIESGVDPNQILLLTFTNKAAHSMTTRIKQRLPGTEEIWSGTFHAIGHRILQTFAPFVGIASTYSIIDENDAVALLQSIAPELSASTHHRLYNAYNWFIATSCDLESALLEFNLTSKSQPFPSVLREYQSRKQSYALVDFADLLFYWHYFLTDARLSSLLTTRFEHILVDEYQDVTPLQATIAHLMALSSQNLMVVGDDRQAIYSFRGASPHNLTAFAEDHPQTTTYFLETNYRSTPDILEIATRSIAQNTSDISRSLVSYLSELKEDSSPIPFVRPVLVISRSREEEALFIAQHITQLLDEGVALGEIAVVYRAASHAHFVENALRQYTIPYTKRGGKSLFELPYIDQLLAYLQFFLNPHHQIAFFKIVNRINGIGKVRADELFQELISISNLEAAPIDQLLRSLSSRLPSSAQAIWESRCQLFQDINADIKRGSSVGHVIERIRRDHFDQSLQNKSPQKYEKAIRNLNTLQSIADNYNDISELLSSIALNPLYTSNQAETSSSVVTLTTIHQAKGLEWETVFLISLTEGEFPNLFTSEKPGWIEEERRIFHVAVTRAKKRLYLSYPRTFQRTSGPGQARGISRFISELSLSENDVPLWEKWTIEG